MVCLLYYAVGHTHSRRERHKECRNLFKGLYLLVGNPVIVLEQGVAAFTVACKHHSDLGLGVLSSKCIETFTKLD